MERLSFRLQEKSKGYQVRLDEEHRQMLQAIMQLRRMDGSKVIRDLIVTAYHKGRRKIKSPEGG